MAENQERVSDERANDVRVSQDKKERLAELVKELAVVHGKVTLSSGKEADYYVDLLSLIHI